ncbi:MAG: chromosome segregation protein SMC [Planctomycetes bacterium]|nr:chromosome segregation protein SMC [Planctomycetota bacterium]
MFLKRISICGFKSFSDKVDFDFGPGITCIVGPNGCGKSNLVDAFKWVLGEQSARSLRGRQMSDMIFSGSSTRHSSGMAQVDLVFDNADRSLPLDQEEVTVTRKLYRSGESEYLLNQDAARLKDIRELFFDTGIGVDAYSVVEQGKVDSLLQSSPVDRRIIFEEAAGISKYKARRREAQRKLDRTQQNMLRVSDVIEELEKRLRSVKLQAGKARNYKEYEARLNELRSSFAMAEFHRFSQEIDRFVEEAGQRADRVTALRTDIDRHEAGEAQLTSLLDRHAEEINAADSAFIQARSERLAQEERIDSASKRVEEQQAQQQRARERHGLDSNRREAGAQELTEMEESAVALQERTRELHERIDQLIDKDLAYARDLTEAQALLEDEKTGVIELLRRSAQMHNEIVRLNTHRESLVEQKGRLGARDAVISGEVETALEQRAQLEARLRDIETLIAGQSEKLEEKKAEAARVGAMRQRLVDELARTKEERSALHSRRELLEDLEQRREGVGAAARQLLDRKQQPDRSPSLDHLAGLVADIFETDVAHAPVIEAALGGSTQHVVMTDSRPLLTDHSTFGDLPGRLTTICLDRLPPVINERDFSDCAGFISRAIDLVRYADAFEQLARHLLGKTVVVDSLESACALASTDVSGHRFVTLKGEVVEPDGRISIGPASSVGGLISRKSELRELGNRRTEIDERIHTLEDQLNRTQAETHHLETLQQELRKAAYEATTDKVEANAALLSIAESVDRLTNEQPLIAQEMAMIDQQIDDVLDKCVEGSRSVETLERENEEREARIETQQVGIDEIVELEFGPAIQKLSAAEFVTGLRDRIGLQALVVGPGARIGSDRVHVGNLVSPVSGGAAPGGPNGLPGIDFIAAPAEVIDGQAVSSSAIREAITAGNCEFAAMMLGRNYSITGPVVTGERRGRKLGFPTANIEPDITVTVPANGIYATLAEVDGATYCAATSIGVRPTFDTGGGRTIEAFLLDFDGDIYSKRLRLEFVTRLRSEVAFESVEQLVEQMNRDVEQTREVLAAH